MHPIGSGRSGFSVGINLPGGGETGKIDYNEGKVRPKLEPPQGVAPVASSGAERGGHRLGRITGPSAGGAVLFQELANPPYLLGREFPVRH